MAFASLTNELEALSLSGPDFLLFEPKEDCAWLEQSLDDIPRYLFRVSTPRSDGITDALWTKSKDVRKNRPYNKVNILARQDKSEVARMLNIHLRWWGTLLDPDNLVSWTSSLLFALQYVFYRHYSSKDRSSLDRIDLCVVDTATSPKGVFVRDMNLIHIFHSFHQNLRKFEDLRMKRYRGLTGSYYFGEYLSQGALKIEDKCQIVSAQAIVDHGLFDIRPEFSDPLPPKGTPWADKVISLREVFYVKESPGITETGIRAALDIAELFGEIWRLPLAANLIVLVPFRANDHTVLQALNAIEKENCSPSKTKVKAYDTLPEVQQFAAIMRMLYENFCLTKLRDYLGEVEAQLRSAIVAALDKDLNLGSHSTLVNATYDTVLRKLDTIEMLSGLIRSEISS
ncbi:MAG: hypothetical protein Q9217_006523 [Psora testacea]